MLNKHCKVCNALFKPCPQVENQTYCSKPECQKARKRMWQKNKRETDLSYRENQYAAHRAWLNRNPEYVRPSRKPKKKPDNVIQGTVLQPELNTTIPCEGCGKMDLLIKENLFRTGLYHLKFLNDETKKMDAWIVEITVISKCCNR
ncbi:MAG: hypothetical protein KGO49_07020 [Gammaproteobacteria bacterium]|nr:hypothetical protein [Gammaproteobacteria bacterium]